MGPRTQDQEKIYDFQNWKHLRRGFSWIFTNQKLLWMVSHDLWAWKQKIVIHGDWNPRAWSTDLTWDWLYSQHIIWIDILRTFGGSCGSLQKREKYMFQVILSLTLICVCITLGMMLRSPARSELLHPKHHQCFMQHPRKFQKHSSLVCHYHGM